MDFGFNFMSPDGGDLKAESQEMEASSFGSSFLQTSSNSTQKCQKKLTTGSDSSCSTNVDWARTSASSKMFTPCLQERRQKVYSENTGENQQVVTDDHHGSSVSCSSQLGDIENASISKSTVWSPQCHTGWIGTPFVSGSTCGQSQMTTEKLLRLTSLPTATRGFGEQVSLQEGGDQSNNNGTVNAFQTLTGQSLEGLASFSDKAQDLTPPSNLIPEANIPLGPLKTPTEALKYLQQPSSSDLAGSYWAYIAGLTRKWVSSPVSYAPNWTVEPGCSIHNSFPGKENIHFAPQLQYHSRIPYEWGWSSKTNLFQGQRAAADTGLSHHWYSLDTTANEGSKMAPLAYDNMLCTDDGQTQMVSDIQQSLVRSDNLENTILDNMYQRDCPSYPRDMNTLAGKISRDDSHILRKRGQYRAPNGQFASLRSLPLLPTTGDGIDSYGPGPSLPRKIRKRRKYEEIDRKYACDFPGCEKAYGTLNHLNNHRESNQHGPRLSANVYRILQAYRESKSESDTA